MDDSKQPPGPAGRPARPRLSPTTALLMAGWLGLCAGYLDVGIIVAKKFWVNKEGAYRSARDFPWTVPAGHVVLSAAPAVLLAVVSWRRPRWVSPRGGAWLLATWAFWAALLRSPFYATSSLALAFGIGKLFGDAVSAYGFGPRVGWVRRSLAGFLVLLAVLAGATTGRRAWAESRAVAALPAPAPAARNVVFIVWDTVRMSNLSLYGYPRLTTPNLDRWASKGVRYEWPLAPSPWTYPSHSSFFTGQWPYKINSQWKFTLDAPGPTLAEFLASRGYQTAGFAANTNCCNYETGLDRGFIHFEDYTLTPRSLLSRTVPGKWVLERVYAQVDPYERKWVDLQSRGAADVNDAFLGWLGKRRPDRPFFAFLNYFDAHEPYVAPPRFDGRFGIKPSGPRDYQYLVDFVGVDKRWVSSRDFKMVQDCYDSCIAYLDAQLGRLLKELERQGTLQDTVVIVTSDHGEAFGEHGFVGHAYAVDVEEVAVPLVILGPDAPAGRSVRTAVSLRDLAATVTDLVGLAAEKPFPGRSLAEHWRESSEAEAARLTSPALSEQADETAVLSRPEEGRGRRGFQMSLVTPDGCQYIRSAWGTERLYYLWTDPGARFNVMGLSQDNEIVGRFRKLLLDALTENRGSDEVEDAYLKTYRQTLAELVAAGKPPDAPGPRPGGESAALRYSTTARPALAP